MGCKAKYCHANTLVQSIFKDIGVMVDNFSYYMNDNELRRCVTFCLFSNLAKDHEDFAYHILQARCCLVRTLAKEQLHLM